MSITVGSNNLMHKLATISTLLGGVNVVEHSDWSAATQPRTQKDVQHYLFPMLEPCTLQLVVADQCTGKYTFFIHC